MVSIVILGLISTAAIIDLGTTRQKDQLDTAVRLVAADLRSLQDRALTGQNILSCPQGSSSVVCELDRSSCDDPANCTEHPPSAVGFHAMKGTTSTRYDLFADVDPAKADGKEDPTEIFLTRDLAQNGAPNVVISDLVASAGSVPSVDVAFQRQNGEMGINGCFEPACTSSVTLRILLRQVQSNEVREVDLNSITGRISMQ